MWMLLVSALLVLASADDASKVVPEGVQEGSPDLDQNIPGLDTKLPTPQQLLEMLDSMTGISDEEKASLREDLLKNIHGGPTEAPMPAASNDIATQTIILLSLLGLVSLIFVILENMERNIFESLAKSDLLPEELQEKLSGMLPEKFEEKLAGAFPEKLQEKLSGLLPENAQEKFSNLLSRYQEMDDEQKEEFKNEAFGAIKKSLTKLSNKSSFYMQLAYWQSYVLFLFALLFVVLVLVFFVYKLFKCLKEREAKREEKKKNKQLKKKK